MKKFCVAALTAVLCLSLAACGECKHEWKEADCENPKTCSLCGETEGKALGHDWQGGDCQNPQVCARCGKEGEVLDTHQEGEWEKTTIDVENSLQNYEKKCVLCGKSLDVKSEPVTSFHDDAYFMLDATAFAGRMNQAFTTITEVEMKADDTSRDGEAYCAVTVDGALVTEILLQNQKDEQKPVELQKFRAVDAKVSDYHMGGPVLVAMIQALDPTMTRETAEELAVKIATLANEQKHVPLENNGICYIAQLSKEGVMLTAYVYTGETTDVSELLPAEEK